MKASFHPGLAELVPGHRLDGRYELLYPYAQGGMAVVWVARVSGKHGFQKLVAIKAILPETAEDESFRKMFLDEARIASGIRHPNVAALDDLGEEAGMLYMALEWVDGDAWSKLSSAVAQRGQKIPLDLVLRMAADACAGLHAAHELTDEQGNLLQVVHRDVSPQNILIARTGVIKVIDFGIAKARGQLAEKTRTGMLRGKLEYASPEQVRMKPLDRRTDVWAMGTLLYQEIAGRLPFEGKNDMMTLKRLTSGKPPDALPPDVPAAVRAIVERALAPDIDARYATCFELQRALEAAIGKPTSPADVSAFATLHLADRMESRRRDLTEALAESRERARARGSVPPPDPAGFGLGPGGSEPPPAPAIVPPPPEGYVASGSQPPPRMPSDAAPVAAVADVRTDELPTRLRATRIDLVHWLMMIVAVLVTLSVWSVVGTLLLGA